MSPRDLHDWDLTPKEAVAAQREDRRVALASHGSERAPDVVHDLGREAAAHHAADVVRAEDFG